MVDPNIKARLAGFGEAGGELEVAGVGEVSSALKMELLEQYAGVDKLSPGEFQMLACTEPVEQFPRQAGLVVARNRSGRIVGAACLINRSGICQLARLGSDGSLRGTGTALLVGVAGLVKELGGELNLFPFRQSASFWEKLGAIHYGKEMTFSAAQVFELAQMGSNVLR